MPIWLLVGAVWAKCAPEIPVTLRGTAPAGATQVCAHLNGRDASEVCTAPEADGTYALGVAFPVGYRLSLLVDRCKVHYPELTVVSSGGAPWRADVRVRSRDLEYAEDQGWWVTVE